MSRSDYDCYRDSEKVHVWTVNKDGDLKVAYLSKADPSPDEEIAPGLVPVLDFRNGLIFRRLLPKCNSYSPVRRDTYSRYDAHSSSSHKKSYRTSRSERNHRKPYEDNRSSREKDKEFTKFEDEYDKKVEGLEDRQKLLFEILDKNFQSILECSKCHGYAIPNPLSCVHNHVFCRACANLCDRICPTIVDPSNQRKCKRNLHGASELTVKFAKECIFRCPYAGCNELVLYDNYTSHLHGCLHDPNLQYRPVKPTPTAPIIYDFEGNPIKNPSRKYANLIPAGAERDVTVVDKNK